MNNQILNVCQMCRRELSSVRMSTGIITNAMNVDTCPPELQCLNWIEFSLLQLIRAVKNMFNPRTTVGSI